MAQTSTPASLPSSADPRWRRAPRHGGGPPVAYLPFAPPFVPRLGSRLRWLRTSVRLVLLSDGFPARLRGGEIVIHPLDGRYLLDALVAEQVEHPRRHLRPHIARTALAIVGRAEPLGEALVMRYADTASSMAGGSEHPSGLAQAYYAASLARAAELLDDGELGRAADRFFAGLVAPVAEGGASYRAGGGVAVATVPTRPRDLVLNGWLSSLVAVGDYASLRSDEPARRFLAANLRTLRRLLPAYDAPKLHLSRYGLTGPLLLRIGFAPGPPAGIRVSRLRVAIPGEGEIPLPRRSGSRWVARAYPEDVDAEAGPRGGEVLVPRSRGMRAIAVLSRAPYPRPNRLRFHLRAPRDLTITVTAYIGRYDPMASATVDRSWVTLATVAVPAGPSDLDLPLPYGPIDLFAYPTNFTRGRPGRKLNSYHATHIVRLRQLADSTGLPDLRKWADRWAAYVPKWARHPEYADGIAWSPEGEI